MTYTADVIFKSLASIPRPNIHTSSQYPYIVPISIHRPDIHTSSRYPYIVPISIHRPDIHTSSQYFPVAKSPVSVVVTTYDFESGRPGSNPEWEPIYYMASITAQGLPEPLSLRGSTLGTRAAEHKGCNWACKLTDGCSLKTVFDHTFIWHMPQK